MKGKVILGVEKEPRPKRTRASIIISGEKLTAKQALHKYPRLREHLLKGRPNIKEATLHAKLRKAYKDNNIPNEITTTELKIIQVERRLLENTVAHFEIHNQVNTSPTDFLQNAKDIVINFFRENPNNKIQIALVCDVVKVDAATGVVIAKEQPVFNSNQKSIFPATDLDNVFGGMTTKILEAFSTY